MFGDIEACVFYASASVGAFFNVREIFSCLSQNFRGFYAPIAPFRMYHPSWNRDSRHY